MKQVREALCERLCTFQFLHGHSRSLTEHEFFKSRLYQVDPGAGLELVQLRHYITVYVTLYISDLTTTPVPT